MKPPTILWTAAVEPDSATGALDAFPLKPDHPVDRETVNRKVRIPLQGGGLHIRSDGADRIAFRLNGATDGDGMDSLKAFYESHASSAFKVVDMSSGSPVARPVKFLERPQFDEPLDAPASRLPGGRGPGRLIPPSEWHHAPGAPGGRPGPQAFGAEARVMNFAGPPPIPPPEPKPRPTVAEWHDGANFQELFLDAEKSIDLDLTPPVTYAEQWEWRYSSLTDYGWLELRDFTGLEPGTIISLSLKVWIESGHVGSTVPECFGVTGITYSVNGGANWSILFWQVGGDVAFGEHSQTLSPSLDIGQLRVRTGLSHSLYQFWTYPEHDFLRTYDCYLEAEYA